MVKSIFFGGILVGLTQLIVGSAFHYMMPVVAPGIDIQFRNPDLFRPWDGWTSNYMAFHPFAFGFFFAAGYLSLRRWPEFPASIRGGLLYGTIVFFVGSLPIFLLLFASMTISADVMMSWILQNMLQYLLAGMLLAYCCERLRHKPTLPSKPFVPWRFVQPPDIEWIEHPIVVVNSRVLLYHHGVLGFGKSNIIPGVNHDPEYLYSDYYMIVEDSEADFNRLWVSQKSFRPVQAMLGQSVGFEFTLESMKGPNKYKILAIHRPSDGRSIRGSEME